MNPESANAIRPLTPELEANIERSPLLNIDTFLIPSPYVREADIRKDYDHSFVWVEEGELLGYILVYSNPEQNSYLIYKIVTSPFVRGRGIGTALAAHLVHAIPEEATVYLYIWERQTDTLEFFLNKGFQVGETIVYRNLVYFLLTALSREVRERMPTDDVATTATTEEIGRTRHDARKTIRLLSNMVDMLSLENCGRIIEDINRETTSLVNTLNAFRGSASRIHEVNVIELILERIVPYVGASPVNCDLHLKLQTTSLVVLGNYAGMARAFINIVANALEAIEESHRTDGVLEIKIGEKNGTPFIRFHDNGIGMRPEQLKRDDDGIPAFVGHSTKKRKAGEGLGTIQIFQTFGAENITVDGSPGRGCTWKIQLQKPLRERDPWFTRLERRYNEAIRLIEVHDLAGTTPREEVVAFVWQTRKTEIVLFDIILNFSTYQNIRTIFRTVFSFLMGDIAEGELVDFVEELRVDREVLKKWLLETTRLIRRRWAAITDVQAEHDLRGALLKSYGQALENVMIFTLNPQTGKSFTPDRNLAEHLDFAPYLGAETSDLLRGEFIGDVNNTDRPIYLGVWSVDSDQDLLEKLKLIRSGAQKLIEVGILGEKKLAFYQTTYVRNNRDIDSDAITTFSEMAVMSDEELLRFTREADDELQGYLMARE